MLYVLDIQYAINFVQLRKYLMSNLETIMQHLPNSCSLQWVFRRVSCRRCRTVVVFYRLILSNSLFLCGFVSFLRNGLITIPIMFYSTSSKLSLFFRMNHDDYLSIPFCIFVASATINVYDDMNENNLRRQCMFLKKCRWFVIIPHRDEYFIKQMLRGLWFKSFILHQHTLEYSQQVLNQNSVGIFTL